MSLCVFEATWRSLSPPYCPLTQPCCLLCGSLIRLLLDGPLRFLTNHLSRNHIGIVSSTPTNFRMANSHIHQRRQHNYSGRHAQTVTSDKRDIVSSSKPSQPHTMEGKMKLIACKLSGNPLQSKAFLQKLPRLSSSCGGNANLNSTNLTTRNGISVYRVTAAFVPHNFNNIIPVYFLYFFKAKTITPKIYERCQVKNDKIVCTSVKHQMRHSKVILEFMTTTINFQ